MKEKMTDALERLILDLEDELKYINDDAVDYQNPKELLDFVYENLISQFEEDLKQ